MSYFRCIVTVLIVIDLTFWSIITRWTVIVLIDSFLSMFAGVAVLFGNLQRKHQGPVEPQFWISGSQRGHQQGQKHNSRRPDPRHGQLHARSNFPLQLLKKIFSYYIHDYVTKACVCRRGCICIIGVRGLLWHYVTLNLKVRLSWFHSFRNKEKETRSFPTRMKHAHTRALTHTQPHLRNQTSTNKLLFPCSRYYW